LPTCDLRHRRFGRQHGTLSSPNAWPLSVSLEEVRNATAFHGKVRLGRSVAISHCRSGRRSSICSAGEQRGARLSASSGQNRLVEGIAPADRFARWRDCRKQRKDRPRRCGTLRRPSSLYGSRRRRDARCIRPAGCEACSKETVISHTAKPKIPPEGRRSAIAELSPIYEYRPFCNGPGGVKSPRVIVTPPSSRFCPWSAPRPPHYAVRRNGEPIEIRGSSDDGHWACNSFTSLFKGWQRRQTLAETRSTMDGDNIHHHADRIVMYLLLQRPVVLTQELANFPRDHSYRFLSLSLIRLSGAVSQLLFDSTVWWFEPTQSQLRRQIIH